MRRPTAISRISGVDAVLRREAAGVEDHQALRHRVHAEREDHRRRAKVGDAEAVDEADAAPQKMPNGMASAEPSVAEEAGRGGRHHGAHA